MRIKMRKSIWWVLLFAVTGSLITPLAAPKTVYADGESYGYDAAGDPANLPDAIIISGGSNNLPPQRLNRVPNTSNYTGTVITSTEAQGGQCSYNMTIDVDDNNISGAVITDRSLNGQANPNTQAFCADKSIGPQNVGQPRITIAATTATPPSAVCTAPYIAEGDICVAPVPEGGRCPAPGAVVQQPDGSQRCETGSGTNTPGGGNVEDQADNCPIEEGQEFRWAMCPLFNIMGGLVDTMDFFIHRYLSTSNTIYTDEEANIRQAWETFRNFGLALVVIAGLVMLISEAFGLSIVDAYTVRKVLPRLFVAVIGVAISWEICELLIRLFDDLGQSIGSIIYTSFDAGTDGVEVWSAIVGQLLVLGAAGGVAILLTGAGVIAIVAMLLVAMLAFAIILVLRQAIIILAVIVAPLAIAAYVLPNTSKFASQWWSLFFSMLMFYPLVTGIIAFFKVMGRIIMNINGG